MRNTRLSALLSQHVTTTGLESDATPADAAAEIPAADEASPVVEEAPASEETVTETPAAPTEEITETAAPATEDATPADDAGVIVASGDNAAPVDEAAAPAEAATVEEAAVAAAIPTEEVVVETAAELPSDVPADAVVEQAPSTESQQQDDELAALKARVAELEAKLLAPTVSNEGEGDEVIATTPEQDAAQGEAEAAVDAQAEAAAAAEEAPIAEEPAVAETPVEAAPVEEATAPVEAAPTEEVAEVAPAVESPSYEEVAVDDSDLNEALADQAEAEGEVKEVEETHDQLKRAADSLESIALSMESALNDGGLHPQAAKFMQIAVESQLNAIGVEQPVIPSLESFGGMSARMRATQVSLEGIKETIAKVWEQIVAILKKLRDAAIAFFKRVFTSVGRLRDYLEALEKKLDATGDKTSTIELVVPAALANRLAIGEKLPRDLAGAIEDIVAVALDSTEFDKEVAEQLKKDHDAVVDAVATGDAEAAAKIMKNFVRMPKSFKRETQEQKFGADVNTYLTAILPGNVRIGIGEYKTEVLGVSIAYLNTGTFREETAFEDGVKMPMLSKSDIKKVIAASKQACVAVGAMEHLADGEFQAASAAVADLKVGENAAQMTALLSAYRQRGKVLMQLSQRIAGHAVATAGAAAKVAHMAVEQYEAK